MTNKYDKRRQPIPQTAPARNENELVQRLIDMPADGMKKFGTRVKADGIEEGCLISLDEITMGGESQFRKLFEALAAATDPAERQRLKKERIALMYGGGDPTVRNAMMIGEHPQYQHAEAFCLMWYACRAVIQPMDAELVKLIKLLDPTFKPPVGCGHRERIWNSRDGVTPFAMSCPSCGNLRMEHDFSTRDVRVVDHKPHHGQRIWRDATHAEWRCVFAKSYSRPEWNEHFKDKDETYLYSLIDRQAQECVDNKQPYLDVTP